MSRVMDRIQLLEEEGKLRRYDAFCLEDALNNDNKEIRAKAIDEFVEKLLENAPRNWAGGLELGGATCYLSANKVKKIAEQLKGVRNE